MGRMARKKQKPGVRERLQKLLREIFLAKREKNPSGVSDEAFGEDNDLLNYSSRVNAWEILTPEQIARIEEIWKREMNVESSRGEQ